MTFACVILAVLSIWDYPSRQIRHEQLSRQFVAAVRAGDTPTMVETCEKGVRLLPDDPTWAYNLACSLAYRKDVKPALDQLEKAIDLGFRNADAIAADKDLSRLSGERRFRELVEYAREISTRRILTGPLATVPATGVTGVSVKLGEQNVDWNFDLGCFEARLKLAVVGAGGNHGDLYMNRDLDHSLLNLKDFPGLTRVSLDEAACSRRLDRDLPNMLFPLPVFGNASRAFRTGPMWRSMPRNMMTCESHRMKVFARMYASNQFWVFPIHADCPPVGTNGDVLASQAPYYLATCGSSYTDQYYLRAGLQVSRSLDARVKAEIVRRGLLAPTVQTLIRKSLQNVVGDADYLSAKAHPTAFPANGLDLARLVKTATELEVDDIPPVAAVQVGMKPNSYRGALSEVTYVSPFACAFVLRADENERDFRITAAGGDEYAFVQVHGKSEAVTIERLGPNAARVLLKKDRIPVNDRVDVAVFARRTGRGWGAPSFVSFATVDPAAPYSDPVLTPQPQPTEE